MGIRIAWNSKKSFAILLLSSVNFPSLFIFIGIRTRILVGVLFKKAMQPEPHLDVIVPEKFIGKQMAVTNI